MTSRPGGPGPEPTALPRRPGGDPGIGNRRKARLHRLILTLLFLAAVILEPGCGPSAGTGTHRRFGSDVREFLMERLDRERPLPSPPEGGPPGPGTTVYILGGSQKSLRHKIRTVGRLYGEGLVRKVLVLHAPGITEYSPALGRNLTNDEWMLRRLESEGVPSADVEWIAAPPSLFGTFGEARAVSRFVRTRGVRRLALVSSRHHLERAWITFSHFLRDDRCELYTYGSAEWAGGSELLAELFKLGFYKYLLLPAEGGFRSFIAPDGRRIGRTVQVPDRDNATAFPPPGLSVPRPLVRA